MDKQMVWQEITPMDDMVLVLDRKDLTVSMEGKLLVLRGKGIARQSIPTKFLGLVTVHGNPVISCGVWRALAEMGIPVVLFPGRGCGATSFLGGGLSVAVHLRMAQHRAANRNRCKQLLAIQILEQKIENQLTLLEQVKHDMMSGSSPFKKETDRARIERCRGDLKKVLSQLPTIEAGGLMGIEGSAAFSWFSLLSHGLDQKWGFTGRNRRPPLDPFNALLSLGYTLLNGEMGRYIQRQGLDPAVGFLHAVAPGRDSLSLDLIEPLRAGVDALALSLLADTLHKSHFFFIKEQGCRLNKEGRGLFYEAWSQWRADWPIFQLNDKALETADLEQAECQNLTLGQCCHRVVGAISEYIRRLDQRTIVEEE